MRGPGPAEAITAATMTIATFPIIVFSVLAADLIEDLDVTRAQVGLLVTATALVGALVSPYFGRVSDSVGAVRSTRYALLIGAATLGLVAAAPSYWVLIAAALATGIPNGWGNPSTNLLIVDNIPAGSRGVLTGIKQSGVQMGTFLGGLLLPVFADLWNWRVAVALFVSIPILAAAGLIGRRAVHQMPASVVSAGSPCTGSSRASPPGGSSGSCLCSQKRISFGAARPQAA